MVGLVALDSSGGACASPPRRRSTSKERRDTGASARWRAPLFEHVAQNAPAAPRSVGLPTPRDEEQNPMRPPEG